MIEVSANALLIINDTKSIEQLKRVIASHLDRFAFREAPLPFRWLTNEDHSARTSSRETVMQTKGDSYAN